MADVDTNDILRIGALWTHNAVTIIGNTFHVRVTAGGGLDYPDAADDVSEYMEDIYDEVDLWFSDEMATYGLTLANITQDTTYGAFAWTNPMAGTEVAGWLPQGVCCLTWGRTTKPRVQTRKYWGVFTEAGQTDGKWVAAVETACATAHNLHHTAFVGTNGLTVLGVAYNRLTQDVNEVTSIASTDVPAYQRRRRLGRGA